MNAPEIFTMEISVNSPRFCKSGRNESSDWLNHSANQKLCYFQNNKIKDLSKSQELADDKIKKAKLLKLIFERVGKSWLP